MSSIPPGGAVGIHADGRGQSRALDAKGPSSCHETVDGFVCGG